LRTVRAVFLLYLVVIAAGITAFSVIGLVNP
jgi:hypothetical protein